MQLYNTLTRQKEEFQPRQQGKVGIYACGVTVYDDCHMGHARSAVIFDVIVRYLRYRGFAVTWVRNFTDIDDKIIQRAQTEKLAWDQVAEKYIASFHRDMAGLGLSPADLEPCATAHIKEIIDLIRMLEDKGFAYASAGDVYFAVARFPGYGKLSGRSLEDMQAGARLEVNSRKENPLDFALWKSSKPGEPSWDSPWGPGRPGWHIECSAMSRYYLGDSFDIHGGGLDLIFPHHENEIAQSEAATGVPLARYWVHNGMITINQEKMSKSLGNFFTVQDVLSRFHPEVIRFFLIQSHYRSPLDFSDQALAEAKNGLLRLYSTLERLQTLLPPRTPAEIYGSISPALPGLNPEELKRLAALRQNFEAALDDDFNTAQALGHLFDAVRLVNRILENSPSSPPHLDFLAWIRKEIIVLGEVLNLLQADPADMVVNLRQQTAELKMTPEEIDQLIAARNRARKQKDYAQADAIRQQLSDADILLEDTPQGTIWRVKD